jgi:indole-3-glycerol phosphate synthase
VLDESMLLEAALHGADAVLLIAAILEDGLLRDLRQAARALGLAVLLEVHDERELERALPHAPELLGVNARDLRTLHTDLRHARAPAAARAGGSAARGRERAADGGPTSARVRAAGAQAVLIGEALVQSQGPGGTLRAWREALRG